MFVEYKIKTSVVSVDRIDRIKRAWKNARGEQEVELEDLGWHLLLKGSHERLYVGRDKPDFVAGDRVDIIIRKS